MRQDALAQKAAGVLSLAAAPTFAIMALLSAGQSGAADLLCAAMPGAPLSGMTAMYGLMSVFHLAPWLKRPPLERGRT